jgi:hypothetical protein
MGDKNISPPYCKSKYNLILINYMNKDQRTTKIIENIDPIHTKNIKYFKYIESLSNSNKIGNNKCKQIFKLMETEIDNLRKDESVCYRFRQLINNSHKLFIKYSFNDIKVNFSSRDIIYINDKPDNIFSIHTADNLAVYLYISNKCKDILGFKRDFIIGKCLYSLLHQDDFNQISQKHDIVLKGNQIDASYRLITNQQCTNGKNQYIRFNATIKKVDNIIITYVNPKKKSSALSYAYTSYKKCDA